MKKKKKGFTLTELIIVIAIIAILAAVLIPSITGYVNKAKKSNDTVNAKNMTLTLQTESIFDEVDYYEIDDVEKILTREGYDLSSSAKGYSYWYDRSTNSVKLAKTQDEISKDAEDSSSKLALTSNDGANTKLDNTSAKYKRSSIECLSSYHPAYQYLDKKDDALTKLVSTIRSLVESSYNEETKDIDVNLMKTSYSEIVNEVLANYKKNNANLKEFIDEFNLNDTIYVDEYGSFNTFDKKTISYASNTKTGIISGTKDTTSYINVIKHIVYSKDLISIGTSKGKMGYFETDIVIPSSVRFIEANSFLNNVYVKAKASGYIYSKKFSEQNGKDTYIFTYNYTPTPIKIEIYKETQFINSNELARFSTDVAKSFINISFYSDNSESSVQKLTYGYDTKNATYNITYLKDKKVEYVCGVNASELQEKIVELENDGRILKVTVTPAISIINKKDGGVIDFGEINACITKIVDKGNYKNYVFAVYCSNNRYKITNIGTINNVTVRNNLYIAYENKVECIKNENLIDVDDEIFNLYKYDDLNITVSYEANNTKIRKEDKVSTDTWIETKTYLDTIYVGINDSIDFRLKDINHQDLNLLLQNDLKAKKGQTYNNIVIKKIEIKDRNGEIIFIQSYE